MKNCLKVDFIEKKGNKINYLYSVEGKWNSLLNMNEKMFAEYEFDVENIPDSIAIIPFLCNILPICWVFDLRIEVSSLDKYFYDCLSDVKAGYQAMYPNIPMLGEIIVEKVAENKYTSTEKGTLFSGGVDAFNTLFQHIEEKPMLLTLWGADIKLNDIVGWDKVCSHHKKVAKEFSLEFSYVKSNFRASINYGNLSNYVRNFVDDEWWHGFQHGIAILGHMAPVAYIKKLNTIYIASSFTQSDKGNYTCASDPTIDNYVKYGNCNIVHDGYDFNRQDKIKNICNYLLKTGNKKVDLRVCWKSDGGDNCCNCEKCYRTIMGIIAEKQDPNDFGFLFTDKKRKTMIKRLPRIVKYNFRYKYIQSRFIENYSIEETPNDLMWFRNIDIKSKKPKYVVIYEKILRFPKRVVKKLLKLTKLI